MRTQTSVLVEDNPTFVLIKSDRFACSHCNRTIGTYVRRGETKARAFWHRADQGSGTFTDPVQFRKCPGSGKEIR